MVLLSIGQSLIPTISLSCITLALPHQYYGIAFGVMEVMDSLFDLAGNILFGLLYDLTGGYFVSMILVLVMSLLGITVLIYLRCLFSEFQSPLLRQAIETNRVIQNY